MNFEDFFKQELEVVIQRCLGEEHRTFMAKIHFIFSKALS